MNDKVALVTGAARGIGRSIALTLAGKGAKVAVNDLEGALKDSTTVDEVRKAGGESQAFPADVSQATQVEALVKGVVDTYGRIDILVNNAGITRDGLLLRMSEDDWDRVMSVNLKSAYLCTREALKHMVRQRWGRVINMSSVVALRGNPGQANYAASKAALIGFTKTVAREVASRNITVNALAPGFIDTEMVKRLTEEARDVVLDRIPMKRFGTPEDVAAVAAFLASEEAGYVTGQVIGIDGGIIL